MLNRTIYRPDADHEWLRNQDPKAELKHKNMSASEKQVVRKLIDEHGLKYLYPEQIFYKTHKITRGDFLKKLESKQTPEEREELIR
jgi:hypothetical protein